MQFPTVMFAGFFAVVLAGAWALAGRPTARKWFLLAAGGVFYGYWDLRFLGLLGGVVVASWALGRGLDRAASARVRRALLVGGVLADVGALAFFKYYGFFVESLTGALAHVGLHVHPPLLEVVLPVGVSFYTFEAISYLVLVHRREVPAAGLLDVAVWLSFFPKLTSGPITRASEFLPQLAGRPDAEHVQSGRGLYLVVRGLVKKLVIASFLTTEITDGVFADPRARSSLVILVGVYAYAAQIYADFSGYTDMAIGFALLLGFRLPENFDAPYTATSVQDFWSRWHMTLSRWLRDYLFAPLTRRGAAGAERGYAAIVVVMLVAGLWHGAAWTFVAFGAVHGVAMALERFLRVRRRAHGRRRAPATWWRQALRRVGTFHVVCLGWVFFAAGSLGNAGEVLRGLVRNWSVPVTGLRPLLLVVVAGVVLAQYLPRDVSTRVRERLTAVPPAVQAAGFGAALLVVGALAPTTVPPFIYYRF